MSPKPNGFLKTPKGKLAIALGVLGASWLFALAMYWNDISSALASGEDIKALKLELEKAKETFEKEDAKKREADAVKKAYLDRLPDCWLEEKNGDVELAMRTLIEGAASKCDVKLSSIGSVRISRINTDLYYAELDFSVSDEYSNIIAFIAAVEQLRPSMAWRRLEIRPEFRQPNRGGPPGSPSNQTSGDSDSPKFRFSGAVRITGYDGEMKIVSKENAAK